MITVLLEDDLYLQKKNMSAYYILLKAHGGFRWIILLLIVVVTVKSLIGLFGNGKYSKLDNILAASFVGFMLLQLLLGLILYFISPLAREARAVGFGNMMADSELRFWGLEHLLVMFLSIAAAQAGRTISKKAEDDSVKFRFQSIFFGLSLLLMLIGLPWDRM